MNMPLGVHSLWAGLRIAYVKSGKPPGILSAATAHSLASEILILRCTSGSDRSRLNGNRRSWYLKEPFRFGELTRQVRNVLEQDLRIASKAAGKSKLLRRR
jgi:hypothetical protein